MLTGLQSAYGTPYWTSKGFRLGGLRGFRGLGCGCSQTDDTGMCMDPEPCGGGSPDSSANLCALYPSMCATPSGSGGIVPTGPANPAAGFNVPGLFNTIATDFSTIFKAVQPVPAGCTQVAGPYGTSVSCANPGQPAAALNVASSLTSFLPILLLGGGVLFAIKAFSGGGR
jgi:hypothetical protein